ncbi:MAG: hypothetical protein M3Z22_01750 [Verrucomicrobiota bacterium]|nr:hypothetical protein [Verrucomicrobiota bacterium]
MKWFCGWGFGLVQAATAGSFFPKCRSAHGRQIPWLTFTPPRRIIFLHHEQTSVGGTSWAGDFSFIVRGF